MARKNIAVLDFGTSHISVMIGDRGAGNGFDIRGYSNISYAGFMDGEFLEPEKLASEVQQVLALAENNARVQITHLYIGVPAEFSAVVVKKAELNFYESHKITDQDISDLFDSIEDVESEEHSIINRAPIYYVLDDNLKIIKPKGKYTTTFSGVISFVLAENKFIQTVQKILSPLYIQHVEFFSEQLCEALYLIPPEERDRCALLVDVGFLTSSFAAVMGDGLLSLNSFSLGAGHIIADFCDAYGLTFDQAKDLLLEASPDDEEDNDQVYEIAVNGDVVKKIPVAEVSEIIKFRLTQIGKTIKKCIDQSEVSIPESLPVLITGGGISYINDMTHILEEVLNREVEIVMPDDPRFERPELSSVLSMLDLAIKQNKQTAKMFFIRLFKKN